MGYKHWTLDRDDENIVWLSIDVAGASTNVLSAEVLTELSSVLDELKADSPQAVVFKSAKTSGFIAGADIREFTGLDYNDALTLIKRGHEVFDKIESFPCATISMIHGFCLGGGTELSLACRYMIASDDASTKIGLPEVKLGIHPGFGGSLRCIQRIGPIAGMDMMLTGRNINARRAKKLGLVDEMVSLRQLERAARFFALNQPAKRKANWKHKLLNQSFMRPLLAKQIRKQVAAKAPKAHYPAPYKLIDLWVKYYDSPSRMLEKEAESVAELVSNSTAQNLVRVYFLQEQLKSLGDKKLYKPVHVHVIGGGIMGGDIAAWCAYRGFHVSVQDKDPATLARTIQRAHQLFKKRLKHPRLITNTMDQLTADHKGYGVEHADMIIEAIFEDAEIKQNLYKEIEPRMKKDAILATNTSSIPLETLATVLNNPGRLVGLHFFNPVALMPLVEIVNGENTDDQVLKKAAAFARHIDKLPLTVKSTPGFLVNRILMPYLLEAVAMYGEGIPAEAIDKAALKFGMPMGPIELADTVGLDVCLSVAKILSQTMNVDVPEQLDHMVKSGIVGKKKGKGFYTYRSGKAQKDKKISYSNIQELQDRLVLRLLNEATACLREGVVDNADLLDAGVIFGTGFAPFRGGPLKHIHDSGKHDLQQTMESLQKLYGDRFNQDAGWNMV